MNLIVSGIVMPLDHDVDEVYKKAVKISGISRSNINDICIYKKSVDARKGTINIVYSVFISLISRQKYKSSDAVCETEEFKYALKPIKALPPERPVIIGAGPAGLFSCYLLVLHGVIPVVIERGNRTEERVFDVENFFSKRKLNTESNIQFGEGGAGTFSDGKLVTRINDLRCRFVLDTFVKFGAPPEICFLAKPHIGTDRLRQIIVNMRTFLQEQGVEFRFGQCVNEILFSKGRTRGVVLSNGDKIPTDCVILATGHSARDTYKMLYEKGVAMEKKPFSVGVRIEHKREFIDKGRYGKFYNHPELKSAEYQFSLRKGDRGCYTFCMCPGGTVVAASSEENTVVVNGMSNYNRDGENSNAAVAVSVLPEDLDSGVLSGIDFQRQLEKTAFLAGGFNYSAPVQLSADFLSNEKSNKIKTVVPTYPCGYELADFNLLLPSGVSALLQDGLRSFDKKIKGYSTGDGVLTGIETRTSAPVRILRRSDFQSLNYEGLYPAGEGAGYAGGITSAAVDGLKVAEAIIEGLN